MKKLSVCLQMQRHKARIPSDPHLPHPSTRSSFVFDRSQARLCFAERTSGTSLRPNFALLNEPQQQAVVELLSLSRQRKQYTEQTNFAQCRSEPCLCTPWRHQFTSRTRRLKQTPLGHTTVLHPLPPLPPPLPQPECGGKNDTCPGVWEHMPSLTSQYFDFIM